MSKSGSESGAESNEGGGGGPRAGRRQQPGAGGRQQQRGEGRGANQGDELATKILSIQSKRVYLDVKENQRGRFIKLAAVGGDGRKSKLFMSMWTANAFKDLLDVFLDELKKIGDSKATNTSGNSNSKGPGQHANLLHSEQITGDRRRYYIDLRDNDRGRFLKVSQSDTSMGTRSSIVIPAEGLNQLKGALAELLEKYGEGYMDEPAQVDLPESRELRNGNRIYYFDAAHGESGDSVRISELQPSAGKRTAITISLKALPHFLETLQDIYQKFGELRGEKE